MTGNSLRNTQLRPLRYMLQYILETCKHLMATQAPGLAAGKITLEETKSDSSLP